MSKMHHTKVKFIFSSCDLGSSLHSTVEKEWKSYPDALKYKSTRVKHKKIKNNDDDNNNDSSEDDDNNVI